MLNDLLQEQKKTKITWQDAVRFPISGDKISEKKFCIQESSHSDNAKAGIHYNCLIETIIIR